MAKGWVCLSGFVSSDDDLRALVRKLRVGQDELREEVRNRQEELIQNLIQKVGDRQA